MLQYRGNCQNAKWQIFIGLYTKGFKTANPNLPHQPGNFPCIFPCTNSFILLITTWRLFLTRIIVIIELVLSNDTWGWINFKTYGKVLERASALNNCQWKSIYPCICKCSCKLNWVFFRICPVYNRLSLAETFLASWPQFIELNFSVDF